MQMYADGPGCCLRGGGGGGGCQLHLTTNKRASVSMCEKNPSVTSVDFLSCSCVDTRHLCVEAFRPGNRRSQ